MRIVIDMQGAQCESRSRGIGRYTLALARAMVEQRGHHNIILCLSGLFPHTVEPIRAAFDTLIPQDNIKVWFAPEPVAAYDDRNSWRRHVAELVREDFIAGLKPDVLHISSLIEGFGDNAVHTIGKFARNIPTAATFYDVIPLIQSDVYLDPNPTFNEQYREKLAYLKKANLLLAISESSRQEALQHLGMNPQDVINIGAAVHNQFKPIKFTAESEHSVRSKFALTRPFLMYSGATDERKNHLRLIKAFSILPDDLRRNFQLAIVGHLPLSHKEKFLSYARHCGLKDGDVVVTEQVSDHDLLLLYNLCALFVFPSWHEGFGLPALEAMSCGAPVIASNTTSLPEVIGRSDSLFDPFDERAIAERITAVLRDEKLSKELSRHGIAQSKKFSWEESARRALTAFERFESRGLVQPARSASPQLGLLEEITRFSSLSRSVQPSDEDLKATASSIARNRFSLPARQLLVDVSELVHRDSKTGIQRVVRSILRELHVNQPPGFVVEPVYASAGSGGYRYARQFSSRFFDGVRFELSIDDPVEFSSSDVFIVLDLQHAVVLQQAAFYEQLRITGVPVYFVVYDLLPVLMPEKFPDGVGSIHAEWLSAIAKADGLLCISRAVADELKDWLDVCGPQRSRPLKIGWFHLGADLAGSVPTRGLPADAADTLAKLSLRPTFLMVGTLEPRKGHLQAVGAFEELWNANIDVNLVFVGAKGWDVDLLVDVLRVHSERNKRLFWLNGISDEYLELVYARSVCLVAASEGEGFGLPLIEAAQHGKPIIARDIPVFREVAGENAFYFEGLEPASISRAVTSWLALPDTSGIKSERLSWLTWAESTRALMDIVLHGHWYKYWLPDGVKRFYGGETRMHSQVGKRSGLQMRTTGRGGCLLHGPYIPLAAGRYSVTVEGHAFNFSGARIDVVVDRGASVLAQTSCGSAGDLFRLSLVLDRSCTDLEVRIWVSEETNLTVSKILIALQSETPAGPAFVAPAVSTEAV